jgi:hypothetical protein
MAAADSRRRITCKPGNRQTPEPGNRRRLKAAGYGRDVRGGLGNKWVKVAIN